MGVVLNTKFLRKYLAGLACLSLSILPFVAEAQLKSPYSIQLKTTQLQPAPNALQWLWQTATERNSGVPRQVLLQFDRLPTLQQKEELQRKGIEVQEYVNGNAYRAIIRSSANASSVQAYSLRSITDIQPEWKAERALWNKLTLLQNKGTDVFVSFYKGIKDEDIRTHIMALGGTIAKSELERLHCYRIHIAASDVITLAQWHGVKYISPANEAYHTLDVEQNASVGGAIIQAPVSNGGYGMKGDGVTIGIGDNVSGVFHVDVVDHIINYHPGGYTNHGQHMNGIVGSSGILDPKSEGVVPHATLVDHIYDNVLAATGSMRAAHDMNITNNSYAVFVGDTSLAGVYDNYSVLLDELALEYTDVLHVFASGNDGYMARPPYPMTYGTVCGGYQPAKNNIVVTNSNKKLENRWEASKGPVNDGRLKPELSAIGNEIISTTRNNRYLVSGGTSMACPQVSGLAGLLTQRYKQLNGNAIPRADVLKALLLNGAYDDGNPGPDYKFGYGMVDLYRSFEMLDSNRFVTNTLNTGGQNDLTITVPVGVAQLKVMLCYHDRPGSLLGGGNELVNDLDIEVIEPSTTVHYPLVLNPNRPDILNFAIEGRDSLNNTEQVTINNPAAGTYTIRVKGYSVPEGPQPYVVAYDFTPLGISFKNPVKGTTQSTNDSLNVYWDASNDNNTFTLEYSTNNGGSWTALDNNIPSTQKYYTWFVPNVSSELCKMRLTRNTTAQVAVSDAFVINPKPVVYVDSPALCPGYIKINWSAVPNASGYVVMRKKGWDMQPVATVNDTTYTFSGLSLDSTYFMAVQPLINGVPGYRSLGVIHKPVYGNCAGSISDGDLMIERILQPISGRRLTSTELGTNETMVVRVRNLDDAPSGAYTIHYAVNGVWQTQTGTGIPANGVTNVSIPGLNLSAAGSYDLRAAIQNNAVVDVVNANDSARKVVRQLNNNPVSLVSEYLEGFENFGNLDVKRDSAGISPDEHWDYINTLQDTGRLRSAITDSFRISGNHSITMDLAINNPNGNQNYLIGTFNFTGLDTASDEVRMDFDYMIHGRPKFYNGNEVWVRGSDMNAWVPIYHYDTALSVATIVSTGTLSVTQALKANGQNFSSSFQVRIGQNDTSLVASKDYGNGTTLDNFRFYTLQKDMQMVSLLSPVKNNCGLNANVPVSVRIYNSVSQVQNNTQLNYRYDGGAVVSELLATVAGQDTVDYVFTQTISNVTPGPHTISVWLSAPGDGFLSNDSLLNRTFFNQPLIATFPHLQDFEASDGFWHHEGTKDSWEYGTPASSTINTAASGTKAWKTNLDGYYNNLELSYLYTPCFDISSLDSPILSFKLIYDIEFCNPLCDKAYMEYSYDGLAWTKLGMNGQGTNWYKDAFDVWYGQDSVVWRDAILPLPQSTQPIRMRYVFSSDQGTEREGVAIDDFRIFNYADTTIVEEPFDGIAIYPNPSNIGYLMLKWAADPGAEMQVSITDVAGRVVYRADVTSTTKVTETKLTTGRFMSGVYFVKVIVGGEEYVRKVVYY
jgi:hypothetical protein